MRTLSLFGNVDATANRYKFYAGGSSAMKKFRSHIVWQLMVLCAGVLGFVRPAGAANIGWVSFHAADNMPSAAAVTAGFTLAPDIGYTNLLKAAGHTVTRIVTSATPNVAQLNGFDIVMISRSNPSGNFGPETADTAAWSSVTKPTVHLGGYAIRGGTVATDANTRLGYTTGSTIPDAQGETKLTINQPGNIIFTGVRRNASNVMLDDFAPASFCPSRRVLCKTASR